MIDRWAIIPVKGFSLPTGVNIERIYPTGDPTTSLAHMTFASEFHLQEIKDSGLEILPHLAAKASKISPTVKGGPDATPSAVPIPTDPNATVFDALDEMVRAQGITFEP